MSEAPSGDTPVPAALAVNEETPRRSGRSRSSLFRLIGLFAVLIALGSLWFGFRGTLPGLEPWSSRLLSTDPSDRLAAVEQIAASGRDNPRAGIAALVRALHDPDAKVRAAAAKATVSVALPMAGVSLGRNHVSAAISTLFGRLGDPDVTVRAEAAQAAWMVVTVAGAPPSKAEAEPIVLALIDRLGDADASVRLAAIRGLHTLGQRVSDEPPAGLLAAMDDEAETDRLAAAMAVAAYRKSVPGLLPSLVGSYDSASPGYREAMLRLIEQIHPPDFGPDVVPGLVAAIPNRDIELVRRAAADIAQFKRHAGTAARELGWRLQPMLKGATPKSPDSSTREALVTTMATLADIGPGVSDAKEAVSTLARVLRTERDPALRIVAAKALSRFRANSEQFAALSERILDPDPAVRHAVIWAIHDVDYTEGYVVPKALATALEHSSAQTREDAAAAICHSGMGADSFVPALVQHALNDSNQSVRGMCNIAIRMLYYPKITAASIPHLLKGLESAESGTSDSICEALGKLGTEAAPAISALIRLLE
jgi:HEAT repeat protein